MLLGGGNTEWKRLSILKQELLKSSGTWFSKTIKPLSLHGEG